MKRKKVIFLFFLAIYIVCLPQVQCLAESSPIKALSDWTDAYDMVANSISSLVSLLLSILAGYFGLRVFFSIFNAEIDLVSGRPGALADVIQQLIGSILILMIAFQAGRFGGNLSMAIPSGTQDLITLKTTISTFIFVPMTEFALVLAITGGIVSIVFFAFRVQLSNLLGMSGGIQEGIIGILTITILLSSGFLSFRLLLSIL